MVMLIVYIMHPLSKRNIVNFLPAGFRTEVDCHARVAFCELSLSGHMTFTSKMAYNKLVPEVNASGHE